MSEEEYSHKYDPTNEGTHFVFNYFYKTIQKHTNATNVAAVPGVDVVRYLKYGAMLSHGPKESTLALFENNVSRYTEVKAVLDRSEHKLFAQANNLRVIYTLGDIFSYESAPGQRCRIEDYGIGIGHRELMVRVAQRLYNHQRFVNKSRKYWKAIITDTAIRQIRKEELLYSLQAYLTMSFGQHIQITEVNGMDATNRQNHALCFSTVNGVAMHEYEGKPRRHNGKHTKDVKGTVRRFDVNVSTNSREIKLLVFTCKNGSEMLQTLLMYK